MQLPGSERGAPTLERAVSGLMLVDGNGLAWRIATGVADTGFETAVLYRATQALLEYRAGFPSWTILLVFDGGRSRVREALYPAYKAHREATPDRQRVIRGLQVWQAALDDLGRPYLRVEGVEADDLISILAADARARGIRAVVVSDDSDLYQCLGGTVSQYVPRKRQHMTAHEALAEWKGSPGWYLLWKALVGDPTDNIPGVTGIGEKRAHELTALAAGRSGWLFEQQARTVLADRKWAKILWTKEGADQFRLAYRLVRTAVTYRELDPDGSGPLASTTEAEVRRVLERFRTPISLTRETWTDFVRRYDVFPLLGDTVLLERLFAFTIQ